LADATTLITSDRTEDRILFALKTRGPTSTSALAAQMRISVPGVRQHLARLADAGLVESNQRSAGVGRPARYWSLTQRAAARFPDTHAELTREMIGAIRSSLGNTALQRVVTQMQQKMEQRYANAIDGAQRLRTRLDRLAAARSADGYMAAIEPTDDGWLLIENHCPICAAAQECQGFCDGELAMFRRLLGGTNVERVDHLLAGARRCAYRVTKAGRP
jgi:predicted ArsR family transcriptional regulator